MDIQDKIALVTGGASGIGLACVKELLKEGARGVAIVDINDSGHGIVEELNNTFGAKSETRKVIFVKADVADKSSLDGAFKATVDQFKNLDIVINNAGIVDEFKYQRCYNVNLIGAANGIHLAMEDYLPKYKSASDAVIVNTASISALEPWYPTPHYAATKYGIIGLTFNFGGDCHLKRTGVRITAICPGLTDTNIIQGTDKTVIHTDLVQEKFAQCEIQDTASAARAFIYAIREGKSGSIHSVVGGKREEVVYPSFSH